MHQKDKRYYELAEKWLNGTITKEEMTEFSEWYNDIEDSILDIPKKFSNSEEELRTRILSQIQKRKEQPAHVFFLKTSFLKKIAAASVILMIGAFLFFYSLKPKPQILIEHKQGESIENADAVVPGGNKAILVLGNGRKLILDSAVEGTLTEDSYTKVIKLDDGQLICSTVGETKSAISFNTLSTPRGGQYAITLIDGTRVWLNSESSLRFPNAFTGSERVVELTGEGYFEVAHNESKPFKVMVNKMEVKVLGTDFNIMAYKDESTVNTTLVTGSVSILHQNKNVVLTPGQQAQAKENGKIGIIRNADVEQEIAWKNGVFNFNGSDIETTMRQISRWYDIEVSYQNKITEHFYGTIVRNASIEKVLKMLEHTGVVSFKMEGRKVIIQ